MRACKRSFGVDPKSPELNPMELLIVVGVIWLIFACLGTWIANQKHRAGGEGFILGFLFGPLGCLIEAVLPNGTPPPPPVVSTPEEIAERQAKYQALVDEWNRQEKDRIEQARLASQRRRQFAKQVFGELARRTWWFLSWQWYRLLPEWLQPVVIGVAIASPVVLIVAVIFMSSPRNRSPAQFKLKNELENKASMEWKERQVSERQSQANREAEEKQRKDDEEDPIGKTLYEDAERLIRLGSVPAGTETHRANWRRHAGSWSEKSRQRTEELWERVEQAQRETEKRQKAAETPENEVADTFKRANRYEERGDPLSIQAAINNYKRIMELVPPGSPEFQHAAEAVKRLSSKE
jgi:hypothetical protein